MKISIIGSGYVGLVTGICFAELGHDVILIDVVKEKIDRIQKGQLPIFEPGLQNLFEKNRERIEASCDIADVLRTDISFICVGTPSNADGSIDLRYLKSAVNDLKILGDKDHIVVVKSTVVPGTTESVVLPALKYQKICVNPEFLREGNAVQDFLNPDRIVIGSDDDSKHVVERLYEKIEAPVIKTDLRTAEMIKYASNAFLAARISLINEIGNLCKLLNIDAYEVAKAIGLDKRIGPHFLSAGIGYGGSCFPKDVKALIAKGKEIGYEMAILKEVDALNQKQPLKMIDILKRKLDIKGKNIAVLGLAFKAETDDVRESPAIKIVKRLLEDGASVKAYDPKAMENFKKLFPGIVYCNSVKEALKDSDACLLLTDWEEFKELTDDDFKVMRDKVIIEGRRILSKEKVKGFEGVCW